MVLALAHSMLFPIRLRLAHTRYFRHANSFIPRTIYIYLSFVDTHPARTAFTVLALTRAALFPIRVDWQT
jgi:hypothetical protein